MIWRRLFSAKLAAAIFVLVALSNAAAKSATGSDWHAIDADGLFTFQLPRAFVKTNMMGMENYLGEYYQGQTRFLFVCQDTASYEYDEHLMRGLREIPTNIDGMRSTIRTFSITRDGVLIYVAELNVGNWREGEVRLYMGLESRKREDTAVARRIFSSIRFTKRGRA